MLGSIGRPRTPPALLISSTASNVPLSCDRSIAAVTPVCENKTPTRQVISWLPSFRRFRHVVASVMSSLSSFATYLFAQDHRPAGNLDRDPILIELDQGLVDRLISSGHSCRASGLAQLCRALLRICPPGGGFASGARRR